MTRTIKEKVPFKTAKTKRHLNVIPKEARRLLVKKYVHNQEMRYRKRFSSALPPAGSDKTEKEHINEPTNSTEYAIERVERGTVRSTHFFVKSIRLHRKPVRKDTRQSPSIPPDIAIESAFGNRAAETLRDPDIHVPEGFPQKQTKPRKTQKKTQKNTPTDSKKKSVMCSQFREQRMRLTFLEARKGAMIRNKASVEHFSRRIQFAIQKLVQHIGGATIATAIVLCILLSFAAIAAMVASPFGLFFSGQDQANEEIQPLTTVITAVNREFEDQIQEIKNSVSYDSFTITHERSADNIRVDNWPDVIAVFAVKASLVNDDAHNVVTIDAKRIAQLKAVFWDMNQIDYWVETIHHDDWTEHILHISVKTKTADKQAIGYAFTADQRSVVKEMLSAELRPYLFAILGLDTNVGLSPEELQKILDGLPEGDLGAALVALALTRLGDPYSQPLAGQGDYVDCSYLVQWCYAQLGIEIPRTAAEQAKFCEQNGQVVAYEDLQPGDLIFWSFEENGRYKDIGHMGIYAGKGMVIDASYSKQMVVYREIYNFEAVVLMGRYR